MSIHLQALKATSYYAPASLPGVGTKNTYAPQLHPMTAAALSRRPTMYRGPVGDPGLFGFIGDVLGGIGKAAVGAVTGLATSGPLGAIGGALSGAGIIKAPAAPMPSSAPLINPMVMTQGIAQPVNGARYPVVPTPGVSGVIQRVLPGGKTGYEVAVPAGGAPTGYHLNKTDYFLRDGTFVPAGTKWVKNRRRNPANSRATNRAISRVAMAKRHAKDLSRITIRKKESCR